MMGEKNNGQSQLPPATKLIFHCHGGGFVAQSSKSHELYLREWAVALDIPIVSVDYSLAPGECKHQCFNKQVLSTTTTL